MLMMIHDGHPPTPTMTSLTRKPLVTVAVVDLNYVVVVFVAIDYLVLYFAYDIRLL